MREIWGNSGLEECLWHWEVERNIKNDFDSRIALLGHCFGMLQLSRSLIWICVWYQRIVGAYRQTCVGSEIVTSEGIGREGQMKLGVIPLILPSPER